MNHSFDTEIAKKYGIEEALILQHIFFWVQRQKANNKGLFEGEYWSYNSKKAFQVVFYYLTEWQIKSTLDSLSRHGLIKKKHFGNDPWDRTLWYTLTPAGWGIFRWMKTSTPLDENFQCTSDGNHQSRARDQDLRSRYNTDIKKKIKKKKKTENIDDDLPLIMPGEILP